MSKPLPSLSSAGLHILAMALMLMDHLWATLLPACAWLTCAGRLAFPIFAFMAVEGYFYTRSLKKYLLRLLLLAVISEIPFDLMYSGAWLYPVHQNVIWTLLIGLLGIHAMEAGRKSKKLWVYALTCAAVIPVGAALSTLCMTDYYAAGVLTLFAFYLFRGRKAWCLVGQIAALYYINFDLLGGMLYDLNILGASFVLHEQGLALLALIPIWLYRGQKGYSSKPFRRLCYYFYPAHMLALFGLMKVIAN